MTDFKDIVGYQEYAAAGAGIAAFMDPLHGVIPGEYSAVLTGALVGGAIQKFFPRGGKDPETNQMAIRNIVGGLLGGFVGRYVLTGALEPQTAVGLGCALGVLVSPYFYRVKTL